MKKRRVEEDIYILAIESSCDETAAAVVKNGRQVLSNVISSQIALHTVYGGVVPEIASRKHIENINQVIQAALTEASMPMEAINAVAVTYGPGLVGALLVGVAEAKAIAYAAGKPLVGVHHIEGHVSANFIEHPDLEPPFICLIVSGGHTHLVVVKDYGEYEIYPGKDTVPLHKTRFSDHGNRRLQEISAVGKRTGLYSPVPDSE